MSGETFEARLTRALARTAAVPPSPGVDRAVRELLAGVPLRTLPLRRPELAAGLALAGLVALLAGLATAFAAAGAVERAPGVALLAVGIYMALSAAAVLPVLLHVHRRRPVAAVGGLAR